MTVEPEVAARDAAKPCRSPYCRTCDPDAPPVPAGYQGEPPPAKVTRATWTPPPPDHTTAQPIPDGFVPPRAAQLLARHARAHGWTVRVAYARFTAPPWGGAPAYLRHGVAVQMIHPDTRHRVVAITEQRADGSRPWGWVAVYILTAQGYLCSHASITDVKEYVGVAGRVLPGWFSDVEQRHTDKKGSGTDA